MRSSGLSKLVNLRTLVITNSRLDDRKCKILVRGLVSCHLEKLELSCCHLEDPAGKAIGFYLINCPNTLKLLELRDNYLSGSGLQGIGYGIQLYSGELDYIGLAGNPIGENGLVALGSGFCLIEQIKRIDISRCDIKGEGPFRLVQMIGFHERLEWLNISAVHIGDQIGEILVSAVKYHWNLLYLDVRGCGLNTGVNLLFIFICFSIRFDREPAAKDQNDSCTKYILQSKSLHEKRIFRSRRCH